MATWDPADELNHPLDFLLIQNGFVSLFCQRTILDEAMTWLGQRSYKVIYLDAALWRLSADMHRDMAEALDFPAYYGHNLDALNDCLSDVATQSYGWTNAAAGLVVVIDGYDKFAKRDARTAHLLLDIYARQAAYAALFGNRMMCLVRTDDRRIEVPQVGGTSVTWNHRE
ncbi:barstar family protein [Paenarthrobacter sp. UW852]|uniref:barstar family protein n=1 Tax=Paenarthrobacter sp. UW852 TaxID=2951989 RepID=UPI002147D36F|nr:barstar family protein [Paenarthrobacter sp. UW852]MCR1161832.1 barstar family protein [Paenarthrobacter sp. UW852]